MISGQASGAASTLPPLTSAQEERGVLGGNGSNTSGAELAWSGSELAGGELLFYHYFINVWLDGALCALGYTGNLLVVVVLHRDKVRTSNMVFLQVRDLYNLQYGGPAPTIIVHLSRTPNTSPKLFTISSYISMLLTASLLYEAK